MCVVAMGTYAGQRVAAFGFMAGFAGAAVGLMSYAAIHDSGKLGVITDFPNEAAMIAHVSGALKKAERAYGCTSCAIRCLLTPALLVSCLSRLLCTRLFLCGSYCLSLL